MCTGIALMWSELPLRLIEQHQLTRRVHERGGEREIRFLWRDYQPLLPIWYEGRLQLVRWGNRQRRSLLPPTGWTWHSTVTNGGWAQWEGEPVDIPANFGLEKGVWFRIRQGVRGILVHDEKEEPVVYMICVPASRYYRVMTRAERMPLLIEEQI